MSPLEKKKCKEKRRQVKLKIYKKDREKKGKIKRN
jgi:hypothetical protein